MLSIYNSLTRKKETFVPLNPGKIGMYACGMTVYDACHLGHARSMVCFDMIVRFLRSEGFEVTFVRNITDIDDKIIARALERDIPIDALTAQYIQMMHEDAALLGVLPPDKEPKATEHIQSIIDLIKRLLDKNIAYISSNGDICYAVNQFDAYGKLSNKTLDHLIAGARVDIVSEKNSPLDFVLWKKAKVNEPFWSSPWGNGRPGWHIECSAMAMDALGEHFDIHGGGLDLQFPHHENEIAQSEAATEKRFANYWMHIGLLQVNNEKMAKSLGNFYTIQDVLKIHHPEVVRYFLLSSHYRSPLNYTDENLFNATKALSRLYQSLQLVPVEDTTILSDEWILRFREAMQDDFNSPIALSILFDLSHAIHKTRSSVLSATLKYLGNILGFLLHAPSTFLQAGFSSEEKMHISASIEERLHAKERKDFERADAIRATLLANEIELQDTIKGTIWRRKISD